MSYMLCNLPLLNSGGSSGAATLNVVGFFFLDRCTQWNILWKPRSIYVPLPMKMKFKKKISNSVMTIHVYLIKKKTYKNTVSKYRFACCKPIPNYRKKCLMLHSDTAVETALDIQCQITLKNMQNIILLWVSFLMFVLMQSMTLLGKYSAGNYYTFLTCFTVCSLNG